MSSINRNEKASSTPNSPQSSTKMSQLVPDASAPPSQVREFISHLLQQREIPQAGIQDIVANWRIGTGREMRGYDPAMYLDIFGAEYGWMIYKEVKLRINEEKCRKFTYKYYWGEFVRWLWELPLCLCLEADIVLLEIIASISAIVLTSAIYVLTCRPGELALWISIYAVIFGGCGLVIALGVIIFSGTAEESIEGELRECRKVGGAKKE
jgi:hypothetical protein